MCLSEGEASQTALVALVERGYVRRQEERNFACRTRAPRRVPRTRHLTCARTRLCIDAAVGGWNGKPLEYHLKAHPQGDTGWRPTRATRRTSAWG